MTQKYKKLDKQLLAWLAKNRRNITTAKIVKALQVIEPAAERHLSRKVSQLQSTGILVCTHMGTMRICSVEKALPTTLAKEKWRPKQSEPEKLDNAPKVKGIKAVDSSSFEAAGGVIEKLPSNWENRAAQRPLGAMTFQDKLTNLD